MSVYNAISLMLLFGMFVLALITLVITIVKSIKK
ncbi:MULTISPECIES: putative holin-like toxin [Bacteria]|uniref:Holin-like toxin n=2 Tax=Lactococcus lactis TaxID=1358 RepID=A0AAF0T061_LACLL|nr:MULTISPECIES: putative holin-like toxin [Lactococcus]TKV30326.1 putative holin-like toxin [Citrobacter sp. TBCS-11]MBG1277864.1 putative holin-like toxin [Lactococcus lactis subsp. lactis]MBK0084443.1 putative holin-like toxin [Lactococcus sp. S64]MBK5077333.1 putative holin-like toxin [Lactococcus lactis]MBN2936279.1 putative holin-like toxin [Lactococcus lactis]